MADPQSNKDAVNKKYADTNFLKLTGGHIKGAVSKDTQPNASNRSLVNYEGMKLWLVEKGNPSVRARLSMANNKIINLGDATDATDAISKKFLDQFHIKSTHKTDQFKYLMQNKVEWTDLYAAAVLIW